MNINPTERARRASAGLLDHLGISQRRAAEHIGMDEKRLSDRLRMGSIYLRDFLTIAEAEEGGADWLRMMADQIEAERADCRPIDAAMENTEAASDAQRVVRLAREDGVFCHYEVLQIRKAANEAHAAATRFKSLADNLEPGPVAAAIAAE